MLLESKPDALVVAGDITNYFNSTNFIEQLNHMPVPVLAIRGNTDLSKVDRLLDYYPNTSSLHLKEQKVNGVKFAGVSGTIPVPFDSRIRLREKWIFDALAGLINEDSVLVVHSPPRGILDEALGRFHAGCRRLYRLVVQRQPRLVLCGHIHERPGIAAIGQTTVVNCCLSRTGRGAMVDFDPAGSFKVEML
jgi:Icc-related predicted phosphoesterase